MDYKINDIDFWISLDNELKELASLSSYDSKDHKYSVYEIRFNGISIEFLQRLNPRIYDAEDNTKLFIGRGEDNQLFPTIIDLTENKYENNFSFKEIEFDNEIGLKLITSSWDSSVLKLYHLFGKRIKKIRH